jgi:hypothetical protein
MSPGTPHVIETTLEIRFPADDRATVLLESNASGTPETQAELILFCLYATRAIANLRQTEAAQMLTESLAALAHATTEELVAFTEGEGPPMAGSTSVQVVLLDPGEAISGDKTFQANVRFLDNEPNPRILFAMKPRGFGLLSKGVDYYAPSSVLALLYALLKRRTNDVPYLHRLARAAGSIGRLATTDLYAFGNQMDVAIAAADVGWRAVPHQEENGAPSAVVECPSCGNSGTLALGDRQFDYRIWPSEAEAIRQCRRCGAGLWVHDDGVRMISSETWLGTEAVRNRLLGEEALQAPAADAEQQREEAAANGSLFGGLKKVFVDYRWPFSEVPGMPVLLSELSGPLGSWTFYAQIVEDRELIAFYSVCPLTVPENRRLEVADFLTRANYGLAVGNFELDFEDGEIRYKTVLEVEGRYISPALVKRLVRANGLAMETYLPGIGAVVAGTPAVPALDRLTTG